MPPFVYGHTRRARSHRYPAPVAVGGHAQPTTSHAPTQPYVPPQPASGQGGGPSAAGVFGPTGAGATLTGLPLDPALIASNAATSAGLANGDIWDTYQGAQIDQAYGIGDTSNPYSRAALLRENYMNSTRGNTNSYAARGQLYSGALQNAQDTSTHNYNIGVDRNQRGYDAAKGGLLKGKLDRYSAAGVSVDTNLLSSIVKALGL